MLNLKTNFLRRLCSLTLVLAMLTAFLLPASAAEQSSVNAALTDTAQYVQQTVTDPQNASVGGEWAVMAVARSGISAPDSWYRTYYCNLAASVSEKGGVLSTTMYTEYARVVLALTVLGQDPTDVEGYNLLKPLTDCSAVKGMNGYCYALLALDSGNYSVDAGVREQYVQQILDREQKNADGEKTGGWAYKPTATEADPDMTAIVLQALTPYGDRADVAAAINRGVKTLSDIQNEDGTYSCYDTENAESCAQVIIALTGLGIDPQSSDFTKNGSSVVDALLENFYIPGKGFSHSIDGLTNELATQQGFCALIALQRFAEGKSSFYDMSDPMTLTMFSDVEVGSWYENYVYNAVGKKLFSGTGDGHFEPMSTMTRGMLVTVLYSLAGKPAVTANAGFTDVPEDMWYAKAVNWAAGLGIVSGTGNGQFSPDDPVTREQITLILRQYTRVKGGDVSASASLDRFSDSAQISGWAKESVSWAVACGLMSGNADGTFAPYNGAIRAEVSVILCNYVDKGYAA